jgi:alpha-1,2-mannosyltransferase
VHGPDSADAALSRRVRTLAIALVLIFPIVFALWAWPFDDALDRSGTPIGADFPVFYTPARLMADGRAAAIYDLEQQQAGLRELFPSVSREFALPFLYPPFVATAIAPLGALSYGAALAVFTAVSIALWAWSVVLLRRDLPLFRTSWRTTATWFLLGVPTLWETLSGAQASVWGAAILVGGTVLLRRGREVAAGLVLALAAYKPNALAIVGLGLVVRYPRLLFGAIPGAAALFALGGVGAGWDSWRRYADLLRSPAAQEFIRHPPAEKYHGLMQTTAWTRDHVPPVVWVLVGAVVAVLVALWWRRDDRPGAASLAVGTLTVAQAMFNPYVPVYDLLQLAAATVLIADGLAERYGASVAPHPHLATALVALAMFGPHVSQYVASQTGVQSFTLALVPLLVWLLRALRAPDASALPGAASRSPAT